MSDKAMKSEGAADIIIRPAAPADMAAVGRLGAMLVREHYEFDPKRFIAPLPNMEQGYGSFLGSQLKKDNVIVLVAEQDTNVIGYVYATLDGFDYMSLRGPAGVIQDIVVDPAYRGNHVGRKLIDAILARLAERGEARVVLSTAERNEPAQRLFAGAGFRRTMIEMTRESDALNTDKEKKQ